MKITRSQRTVSVLRRPTAGPLLFGFIFGSMPFAVVFSRLGGSVVSPELLRFVLDLFPFATVLTMAGALLGMSRGWQGLALGALLTSLSACVPLPVIVCLVLEWRWGYEVLSPDNFPFLIAIFIFWAFAAAISGWLLALAFTFLKNRYSRGCAPLASRRAP
jgi:hypothetical protein